MKISTLVNAGMASILVALSVLACTAATEGPEIAEPESVGTAHQALCRNPPCDIIADPTGTTTHVKPPPPPPPVQGSSFTCTGSGGIDPNNGLPTGWNSSSSRGFPCGPSDTAPTTACVCNLTENPCPPGSGICYGFAVVSTYTCSPVYPVQRCDGFGNCSCWSR